MQKKNCSDHAGTKTNHDGRACSLCGQLYHNFAFKGGYICEDCLDSIKGQDDSPRMKRKDT